MYHSKFVAALANMSASLFTIGGDHPYRFPQIKGFLSPSKIEETIQQLNDNKVWNLSEKLDGCNVTVSSEGWFASRNKIVADCRNPTITERVWNKVSLKNVPLVFEQTLRLKEVLQSTMKKVELQTALYCELVLPGTSTTHFDVYNYEARNIKTGSIYAFALGLLLPKDVHLPFMFDHALYMEHMSNDANNYYIVPMNNYLSQLFKDLDILHIPPIEVNHLTALLIDPYHVDILMRRKKEGFVLTSNDGQGFIKWKYNNAEELKPELTTVAEQLVDSQTIGCPKRSAAEKIRLVYHSGTYYVNTFSLIQMVEYFNTHMAQHLERWKTTFQRAADMGYYYLRLAMRNLEDELLLDLWWSMGRQEKSQLDPKVVLQLKQEFAKFVKAKCWQFVKQVREKIPTNECQCEIIAEETEESTEESSTTSDSDEYA